MPPGHQFELHLPAPAVDGETPLAPARMVNEFVYCPRLAYLMWTQGEWVDTGDTVEGRRIHAPDAHRTGPIAIAVSARGVAFLPSLPAALRPPT